MRLYLWKIERESGAHYDEFDAAIVVARTADDARLIHPGGDNIKPDDWIERGWGSWPVKPEQVKVTKVGTAAPELKAGTVVVASFNAG